MKVLKPRPAGGVLLAVALVMTTFAAVPPSAGAGNGLKTFRFSSSGITLSTSSYKYSNAAGLWQTINNANNCNTIVDGIFGNQTKSTTVAWQQQFGLVADGVVGSQTWNFVNDSRYGAFNENRLSPTGYIDGYATFYYTFYGGIPPASAHLAWNPFGEQWFFEANANQGAPSNWNLKPAYAYRNIGTLFTC